MDIQPVGTLYGIAYYVAKYVAKEEPQHIQNELKDALLAIQAAPSHQFAQELYKTSRLIMKHRERSAQEAAYLLAGLRLKACSRTTIFSIPNTLLIGLEWSKKNVLAILLSMTKKIILKIYFIDTKKDNWF
jgi:hypothetical protein